MKLIDTLPMGTQVFRDIRENHCVYIDKTEYIHELITSNLKQVFLSRPRRFGKTLLVSTMEEIFKGHRELFEDLWIGRSDYKFKPHPVIRLNLAEASASSPDLFENNLRILLERMANAEGLSLAEGTSVGYAFGTLIQRIHEKHAPVKPVVLIDEYDCIINDNIANADVAMAMRDQLRDIFSQLKSQDEHLHFAFITGVTNHAKTTVFSKGSRIIDITFDPEYTAICGFTRKEFETGFSAFLEDGESLPSVVPKGMTLTEAVYRWYDGYSWDGKVRLLNPHSIIYFLYYKAFKGYWYQSGTSLFLVNLIRGDLKRFIGTINFQMRLGSLETMDLERLPLETLLFQTGYLTVGSYDQAEDLVTLRFPNHEVQRAFYGDLVGRMVSQMSDSQLTASSVLLKKGFEEGDVGKIETALSALFSAIPYSQHGKDPGFYPSLLYFALGMQGMEVLSETPVADGTIDILLNLAATGRFPQGAAYIVEFKSRYSKKGDNNATIQKMLSDAASEALSQINGKQYAAPFLSSSKDIVRIGIGTVDRKHVIARAE